MLSPPGIVEKISEIVVVGVSNHCSDQREVAFC